MGVVLEAFSARIGLNAPDSIVAEVVALTDRYAEVAHVSSVDSSINVSATSDSRWTVQVSESSSEFPLWEGDEADVAAQVVDRLHPLFAEYARGVLFIHASVVAFGNSLLLIPGRSRAGKSTLAAEALRRGATYFSDEFAVMGADGLVHPYPRHLQIRRAEGGIERVDPVLLSGHDVAREPLPASAILLTSYVAGAAWEPKRLRSSQAALRIIDNTIRARLDLAGSVKMSAQLTSSTPTWIGRRGEATDFFDQLSGQVDIHRPVTGVVH